MLVRGDKQSLLSLAKALDRLDSGWSPGETELECARFVENWTVTPAANGNPFAMFGISWTLPLSCSLVVAGIFAVDWRARWVRTIDEWVVIGNAAEPAGTHSAEEIRKAGAAWLRDALDRASEETAENTGVRSSAVAAEVGEQFVELRRPFH